MLVRRVERTDPEARPEAQPPSWSNALPNMRLAVLAAIWNHPDPLRQIFRFGIDTPRGLLKYPRSWRRSLISAGLNRNLLLRTRTHRPSDPRSLGCPCRRI